jgi:hypothetical protein
MSYYYPAPIKLGRDIVGPFNIELWPLNNYGIIHFWASFRQLLTGFQGNVLGTAVAVVNNDQHSSVERNLTILLVFLFLYAFL